MKMTSKQMDKLQEFVSKRRPGKCSCGSDSFTIVDKVYEMREFSGGSLVVGGENTVIPVVVLVCVRCGEMKMLSAIMLGVVDNLEKDVKPNSEE